MQRRCKTYVKKTKNERKRERDKKQTCTHRDADGAFEQFSFKYTDNNNAHHRTTIQSHTIREPANMKDL